VEACSQDKIYIDPHPNKEGRQTAVLREGIRCTGCLKCATICPDAAVEVYELRPKQAVGEEAGSD
jgi:NAD-dependent dihydropyrimidine dehydrogenase PreA subunit